MIFCGAVLSGFLLADGSTPSNDPYVIYRRARDIWSKQAYPNTIQFRTTVRVSEGDKPEEQHYRGQDGNGDIRLVGVSEEEQEAPHEAKGANFKIHIEIGWNTHAGGQTTSMDEDAHRRDAPADYLGVPVISPAYSFGLDPRQESTPNASATPDPAAKSDIRTIATVNAYERHYEIKLLGQESVAAALSYHLQLVPLRDPRRYRLRDMWVDVYTYHVLKIRVQGNFTGAPMTQVSWIVTFQDVAGSTYIDTETAEAPLVLPHDRIFTTASIKFDQVGEGTFSLPVLPYLNSIDDLREP
jgi:hypothetical protein